MEDYRAKRADLVQRHSGAPQQGPGDQVQRQPDLPRIADGLENVGDGFSDLIDRLHHKADATYGPQPAAAVGPSGPPQTFDSALARIEAQVQRLAHLRDALDDAISRFGNLA